MRDRLQTSGEWSRGGVFKIVVLKAMGLSVEQAGPLSSFAVLCRVGVGPFSSLGVNGPPVVERSVLAWWRIVFIIGW